MPNVMQNMSDEQCAQILEALGLPPDTSDPNLVVEATREMAAREGGMRPEQPSSVAAAAHQIGCEVVDSGTLAALRQDAAQARQLAAAARTQEIANLVDESISRGAITPARRDHWTRLIEADPEMANTLKAFPNELAAPMNEIGHTLESGPDDQAWVL